MLSNIQVHTANDLKSWDSKSSILDLEVYCLFLKISFTEDFTLSHTHTLELAIYNSIVITLWCFLHYMFLCNDPSTLGQCCRITGSQCMEQFMRFLGMIHTVCQIHLFWRAVNISTSFGIGCLCPMSFPTQIVTSLRVD